MALAIPSSFADSSLNGSANFPAASLLGLLESEPVRQATEAELKESEEIYRAYPALRGYREFLGNISWKDICGNGWYGVVIRSGDHFVGKYPLDAIWATKLAGEFSIHNSAANILRFWKKIGEIPENVWVPRLRPRFWKNPNQPYVMEYISGHSLHTKRMLFENAAIIRESPEELKDMGDQEIKILLKNKYWIVKAPFRKDAWTVLKKLYPHLSEAYEKTISFLEESGIKHMDMHCWNIIIAHDGTIRIIDFWKVKYHPGRLKKFYQKAWNEHPDTLSLYSNEHG